MGIRVWVLGLAVPLVFGVSGCGGEQQGSGVASAGKAVAAQASASPSRSLSPEDAQLKFAQCMRQNGIDVPDPKPGGGNFRMEIRKGVDRSKLQAAMEKCSPYLEASGKLPDLNDPKVKDQMVKFAQCARSNGIDIPDPSGDGLVGAMGKVDRAQLEKARELCGQHLPGRGR
ncbi:hypothetical protein GCM10010191_27620 [Actinomadura vinacea]|uniref:Lipoprotein n=1 Tax=Actinomadura vinacea TaxID=115336 RepID=A0ABN3IXN5_9ACTN